jgi:hypothetical protein
MATRPGEELLTAAARGIALRGGGGTGADATATNGVAVLSRRSGATANWLARCLPKCVRGTTTHPAQGRPVVTERTLTGRLSKPSGHQVTYPGETPHDTHAVPKRFSGIQNHLLRA